VAAGIRRIEAVTRKGAYEYLASQDAIIRELSLQFKTQPSELEGKVAALMNERKKLEKELAETKKSLAMGGGGDEKIEPEMIGGLKFIAKIFDGLDPKELRGIADGYLKNADVVFLGTSNEGKASMVAAVNKDLSAKRSAVDLVKQSVEIVGGKGGGGRPEMAQGGGPDADKLPQALDAIREALKKAS
jgi:alanyl-tRNA synthetase